MKPWVALTIGAALGLLGVAAGAFGAHALRGVLTPRDLEIWETAAHYQQVHAILLVVLGLVATLRSRALAVATVLLAFGIIVFSGSLYALVLGGPRMLGAITPLGGSSLIGGWAAIVVHGLSSRPARG